VTDTALTDTPPVVRRRHVFYLSGFDPRGSGYYHGLYRDEAAREAARGGIALQVGPMERVAREVTRWSVTAQDTVTTYDVLRWDDLIRRHWHGGDGHLLWRIARTTWQCTRLGIWHRAWRITRGAWFCLAFPPVVAVLVLLLPLAVAALAWSLLSGLGAIIAGGVAVVAGAAVLLAGRAFARVLKVDWIMQHNSYVLALNQGGFPGLEERLDQHAARVSAALADTTLDEVLLVAHSAGGALSVAVAARALARFPEGTPTGTAPVRFSLLTIAQLIAFTAVLPNCHRLRAELRAIADDRRLTWVDVGSPADGPSLPLVDPLVVCGLPPGHQPRLLSARLHRKLTPAHYRQVKRNRFRLHFLYLMASDTDEGFNFFTTTAGPLPLSALTISGGGS
jgi:pimeloyl-ACP methyl ester carboxylesterase